ncbi:PREDICTED: uncharacterized protein LOC104709114 [Camelina sativa]|uniref:Uncharacterized protein LOC104709114 n=1 Tax=Camelina sativa TaxID=90675 RepID=A0ABM1QBP6_CAMSA|nr:PREDICTED: uncharacterized protein LOC104709114 [Camelina sativa]
MDRFVVKRKTPPSDDIDLDDLPWDPAKRKRIISYHPNQRDEVRRKYLIRGPCQPRGHRFKQTAIGGVLRRFNLKWFDMYGDWLEYSVENDKAFCLCCYLFKDQAQNQGGSDCFVSTGFCGWNKGLQGLNQHVGSDVNSFHNNAKRKCEHLLHQGLPFRGHDESDESANRGNFLELLKYTAGQNEVVKKVTKSIIEEIDNDVFGLLVDESTDVSDKEQMAVVFRFVDKYGIVKERFVGVIHVKETSSLSLKCAIDSLFAKYGLSMKKVRGQGYDGAIGASCKRKDMIRENYRKIVEEGINNGEIKTGTGLNQEISLQRPGNTRWGSHYKTLLRLVELFSSVVKFNDRFDEVNSELLVCISSLSPIDSFRQFDKSLLMRLAEFYPEDFSFMERKSLDLQLEIYLDNVQRDERFTDLKSFSDLARLMVETRKHLSHPLVYRLLKLSLILPVATATVERCFSAMTFVKTTLRNRIENCSGHLIAKGTIVEASSVVLLSDAGRAFARRRRVAHPPLSSLMHLSILLPSVNFEFTLVYLLRSIRSRFSREVPEELYFCIPPSATYLPLPMALMLSPYSDLLPSDVKLMDMLVEQNKSFGDVLASEMTLLEVTLSFRCNGFPTPRIIFDSCASKKSRMMELSLLSVISRSLPSGVLSAVSCVRPNSDDAGLLVVLRVSLWLQPSRFTSPILVLS